MWTPSSKTTFIQNRIESWDRTKHAWDGQNNVSTLKHIGNSSCPECGVPVDPSSASHGALCTFSCCPESPCHVQCLSRVAVAQEIQCSALVVKEDVVIMLWVGSSECAASTVLNGQYLRKSLVCCAWIRWVTTVSQFLVATKRSTLVASLSLSM